MDDLPEWMARARVGHSTSDDTTRATKALQRYFRGVGEHPPYSGAAFNSFGHNPRSRVVSDDLVAVSMLNGKIRQHMPRRLLELDQGEITDLLSGIPADIDLHEADRSRIEQGSPAWMAWETLRRGSEGWALGRAATSKLLARKRPRLLPAWDARVAHQWSLKSPEKHWQTTWRFLQHPGALEFLHLVRARAGLSSDVPVLRILDVLLWMSDSDRQLPPVTEGESPRT